jgi:membrane associated rhomboid family serine protease
MRPSTRALIGLVVLDTLIVAGAAWLVSQIRSGAAKTAVPPAEAIETITSIAGSAFGLVTGLLAVAFVVLRRQGR